MKQADGFSFSEFQHLYNGPDYLAYVDVCLSPTWIYLLTLTTDKLEETCPETPMTHNLAYGLQVYPFEDFFFSLFGNSL